MSRVGESGLIVNVHVVIVVSLGLSVSVCRRNLAKCGMTARMQIDSSDRVLVRSICYVTKVFMGYLSSWIGVCVCMRRLIELDSFSFDDVLRERASEKIREGPTSRLNRTQSERAQSTIRNRHSHDASEHRNGRRNQRRKCSKNISRNASRLCGSFCLKQFHDETCPALFSRLAQRFSDLAHKLCPFASDKVFDQCR